MGLWILAAVVAVLMLGVVVVALLHGRVDEAERPAVPEWSLPSPRDLADPRFPLAWQGYDPDHVDAWVEGVRRAQEELWSVLGPSGVAELQERLAAARRPRRPAPDERGSSDWHVPVGGREVPSGSAVAAVTPTTGGSLEDEPLFTRAASEPEPVVLPKVRSDDVAAADEPPSLAPPPRDDEASGEDRSRPDPTRMSDPES